jgi:hypothetical protein
MKYAKVLVEHVYNGKRRRVGDKPYPIRRTDYQLFEKLGRIEIVPNPDEDELKTFYHTTAMEAEPPPVRMKRPYRRKAKVAE